MIGAYCSTAWTMAGKLNEQVHIQVNRASTQQHIMQQVFSSLAASILMYCIITTRDV